MLKLDNISKTFNPGTVNEKAALTNLSLDLADGDFATVSTVFDLQYRNGDIRKVVYEFSFKVEMNKKVNSGSESAERGVHIFSEKISMGGVFNGKKQRMQTVIDTSNPKTPFPSASKQHIFLGDKGKLSKIVKYRNNAYKLFVQDIQVIEFSALYNQYILINLNKS